MSAAASTPLMSARLSGKVLEWNSAKGCGFVDDGRRRVFIHIRDFAERHQTPEPGDVLHYSIGNDINGRTCAKHIVQANDGGRLRPVHLGVLGLLLAAPTWTAYRLVPWETARWLAGWVALASSICYALYAWDKRRARRGEWRISENTLHFWEALGGWPGGFIAQLRLRHKCSKFSYLIVFWLIIAAHNYVAIDWPLDWRLSRGVVRIVDTWTSLPPVNR